jgi:hypothetical protein
MPIAPVTSIDPVMTVNIGGGIAIEWTAPDARGSAITAYKIEIANKANTTWTVDAPCSATSPADPAALRCVVLMSTLTAATPYGYSFNDVVYVRVSAKNYYGYGSLSPASASTGAKIRVVPAQMAAPTEDPSSTDVTLIMNWIALSGAASGNSDILGYSICWDNGVSTVDADIELIDTLATTYT